jgi:hypothetical protein
MSTVMTESLQEQLDAAIAAGDAAEVRRLSIDLVEAQSVEQTQRQATKLADERRAAVNMARSMDRRERAKHRAELAVREAVEQAPKVKFEFGDLRIVIKFASSDPGLALAAAEAVKQAALLMQRSWLDRLQAVRSSAATETEIPPLDAEAAAMAFRGALHYQIARGLVQVQVTKKRR